MTGEAFGLGREQIEQFEFAIITGWPVNFDDLPERRRNVLRQAQAQMGEPPAYYPDSLIVSCEVCHIRIFLGPRSRAQYDRAPNRTQILCILCVGAFVASTGNYELHNLGNTDHRPRNDL